MREVRNDPRLTAQIGACRRQVPARRMYHGHGILYRDGLRYACPLAVLLTSSDTGEDERLARVHHVAAIEFGRDMNAEIEFSHGGTDLHRIGRGRHEVAT